MDTPGGFAMMCRCAKASCARVTLRPRRATDGISRRIRVVRASSEHAVTSFIGLRASKIARHLCVCAVGADLTRLLHRRHVPSAVDGARVELGPDVEPTGYDVALSLRLEEHVSSQTAPLSLSLSLSNACRIRTWLARYRKWINPVLGRYKENALYLSSRRGLTAWWR